MKKTAIFGIIVLISVSPLFRGLYFSYDTYAFLAVLALFSVLYLTTKSVRNEPLHLNKPLVLCEIVLLCAASLSFLKALNPRENLDTVIIYVELVVISIVLYDFFHDNKRLFIKWLMIPVAAVGFICSAVGLTALSGYTLWEVTTTNNRIGSTFQYANTAAVYFAICLIFVVTLVGTLDNILLKALFSGMAGIMLFAFFMTGSRGGYLVGMAVIMLLVVLQPHGRRIRSGTGFICMLAPVFIVIKGFNESTGKHNLAGTVLWLAVLFLMAAVSSLLINLVFRLLTKGKEYISPKGTGYVFSAAAVIFAGFAAAFWDRLLQLIPNVLMDRMARLIKLGIYEKNVLYRIEYDKDALKLIPGNWLLGVGGGGWKAIYQSVQDFFYTAAFVHNNYLQVFLESGILGFISFLALVLISLWNAIRFYTRAVDGKLRTYCAGLLCAMIVLTVHSVFDFNLSYASLLLLLFTIFTASAINLPSEEGMPTAADCNTDDGIGAFAECSAAVDSRITKAACEVIKPEKRAVSWIYADAELGRYAVAFLIIACSALLTLNALHFTAAQNAQTAFDYAQEKDYRLSLAYYEEAGRLDTGNTKYSFEMAKLYRYFANKSSEAAVRNTWLEKARAAAEKSVAGARYYPAYMNTLVRIYLDSGMPLEALKYSRELVANQKYYAENYELLARSYIAAADFYTDNGNTGMAEELLLKCAGVGSDPYLRRSIIDMPTEINSEEAISRYKPSENLLKSLKEAENKLSTLRSAK